MLQPRPLPPEAERYFARDPVLNIELSESLRFGGGRLIEAGEHGVLVQHNDGMYMLSATDRVYGRRLFDRLPDSVDFMHTCQEWLADLAMARFRLTEKMVCHKLAYLKKEPIAYEAKLDIRPSVQAEATRMAAHYTIHDLADIQATIADGMLWSGYLGNAMVGFIGRHPEGSMGMLHIFEPYRRRGFGFELEAFLINKLLAAGETPRGDVIVGNDRSVRLQEKLGFTAAQSCVYWVF